MYPWDRVFEYSHKGNSAQTQAHRLANSRDPAKKSVAHTGDPIHGQHGPSMDRGTGQGPSMQADPDQEADRNWVMVTCESPGLVTLQPNERLCQHKTIAVARGVATVKPGEPFLGKICNFGPDTVIIRKRPTVAFAKSHLGQVLTARAEERAPPSAAAVEEARNALEDIDLHDAPDYLHQQIKDMLAKHGKMWEV